MQNETSEWLFLLRLELCLILFSDVGLHAGDPKSNQFAPKLWPGFDDNNIMPQYKMPLKQAGVWL